MSQWCNSKMVRDSWDEIQSPASSHVDNVRLADASHPLDFRLGKDFKGRLIFSLDGELTNETLPKVPNTAGMELEVLVLGATRRIRLTLISEQFTDTFKSLCQDLLRFTRSFDAGTSVDPLRVVILRLLHWHELLRSLNSTLLSRSEIVGLMGELFFLKDVFASRLPPVSAINSWCGPYKDEQDFSINGNIFEIKTSTVTVDSLMQISSENQLDTSSGKICLVHQKIDSAEPGSADSRSLNQLVAEMRDWAASRDHVARELLAAALTHAGWQERAEYDEVRWVFVSRKYYPVVADFPRIVPDLVMRGVERIRYCIRVDEIADFCRPESDVLREYFHDDR